MTLERPPRPINVATPGNAHLIVCVCGHGPDDHVPDAGCIALDEHEVFCICMAYEVAP